MHNREHSESQFRNYMNEVREYLGKVQRGRSVRKTDPQQPAFSSDAETIRQTNKLDEANAYDRLMRSGSGVRR